MRTPPTLVPPPGADQPSRPKSSGGAAAVDSPAGPRRDPIWARLLIGFGALLMLVSASLIGVIKVLPDRYDSRIKKDTLIASEARTDTEPAPSRLVGPLNFLLLGSDARPESPDAGQRADTIIVAHVPASLDRAYLISIPRDLRVQIPQYGPTAFGGSREKINSAYEYGGGGTGGIQLLSATLANLLGVRFDGAALVDFAGFQGVVKALGGVDMCIEQRVVSEHIGFDNKGKYLHPRQGGRAVVYEPGCRELNHWEALDYVRQRKSLENGDYGRQRHQQQFLKAMLTRARERGIATNPFKLDQLMRAVAGTLTVDIGSMSPEVLLFGLRDIRPASISGITVPSEPRWIGNTSYIVALDDAAALFTAIGNDTLDAWTQANPNWVNQL